MTRTRLHERWAIVARNPLYEVSDHGRVRSNARGKTGYLLSPGKMNQTGHVSVSLQGRSECIHTLVAEAFVGPRPSPRHEVRHQDGDGGNNFWRNLEWATRGRNTQDKKYHSGQKGRLMAKDVSRIKRLLNKGAKGGDLAFEYGISQSAISAIKCGHNHAEVQP